MTSRIQRSILLVGIACCALALSAEDFKVSVYREYPGQKCTSGYLAVNGTIVVYTLERPWQDNQQNISSIPAGTYPATLRYDHDDHWRIELQNVPGRTNVQIHMGNQPDDSKGCILVGTRLGPDLCSIVGGTSAPAYAALKSAFYATDNPVETPDKTITVEITDAGVSPNLASFVFKAKLPITRSTLAPVARNAASASCVTAAEYLGTTSLMSRKSARIAGHDFKLNLVPSDVETYGIDEAGNKTAVQASSRIAQSTGTQAEAVLYHGASYNETYVRLRCSDGQFSSWFLVKK